MEKPKEIFLSYCWANEEIVNKIDEDFRSIGITLIRDSRGLRAYESIEDYMKGIRKTDFVLLIISDGYLKSRNCMFEILELIKDENYKNKIIPIILDDANDIFKKIEIPKRIKYWQKKHEKLKEEIKDLTTESISNIAKELKILRDIKNYTKGYTC